MKFLILATAALFSIAAADENTACGDKSHWDAWDAKMNRTTPDWQRLPYGTVCEVLWALDIALTNCNCAPTLESFNHCVEYIIGMTRKESVNHMENEVSNCAEEGTKCCDGFQNCLDLCDAQGSYSVEEISALDLACETA